MKRLSSPAIKHLVVFNYAIGILRTRKLPDVIGKSVKLTGDQKRLNQKRKLIAKVNKELDEIVSWSDKIFSKLSLEDLNRVKDGHSMKTIQLIPEDKTNIEVLGLYLLFCEFQENMDQKLDKLLKPLTEINYFQLIIDISEEIGLEKNVSDDMYELALKIIEETKK